jgi:hypothetical protein
MALYPKESKIARAKAMAVGGKRKRCVKGKNCSAACIAAHMVCLVDLPWVGADLTQAAKAIQNQGGPISGMFAPAPAQKPPEKQTWQWQPGGGSTGAPPAKAPPAQKPPAQAPPAKAPPAKAPPAQAPAASPLPKQSVYTNWTTEQLVKFQQDFINSNPKKFKDAIEEIQAELDSRGYKKPTIAKGPYAQPGTPQNRQGLNPAQFQVWSPFFQPFTEDSFRAYSKIGSGASWDKPSPAGGPLAARQSQIVKGAHQTSEGWNKALLAHSERSLPKTNSIQTALKDLGFDGLKTSLRNTQDFTGGYYDFIRAAQRNTVPKDFLGESANWKANKIAEYKQIADSIERILPYMQKPQVPKMRGVALSDQRLQEHLDLVRNNGVMVQNAMNSWSTQTRTPKDFADDGVGRGHGNNRVIYRTLNRRGSSIRELSGIASEDEILTPSNTSYRFTGHHTVNVGSYTYHVFDMVEF